MRISGVRIPKVVFLYIYFYTLDNYPRFITGRFMKVFSVLMLVVLSVFLLACSGGSSNSEGQVSSKGETPENQQLCPNDEQTIMDCSTAIPHSISASQIRSCNASGESYVWGSCDLSECESGYLVTNGKCLPENGTRDSDDKTVYRELVVDFGADSASTVFGNSSMNSLIVGPDTNFTTAESNGLNAISSDATEFYQGVTGGTIALVEGDIIIVTWFNNSDSTLTFYPLITFTDDNAPINTEGEPQWYIMKHDMGSSVNYLASGSTAESLYVITNAETTPGLTPTSEGNVSLISITTRSARPGLICSKIEVLRKVHNIPNTPQNLRQITSSVKPHFQIELAWDSVTTLGLETKYYKVFRDGEWIDKTEGTSYIDYNLEPGKRYHYSIMAVSEAMLESSVSNEIELTTAAMTLREGLLNPHESIQYMGAFRFPEEALGPSLWSYRNGGIALYPPGDPDDVDGDGDYRGSLYAFGFAGSDNPEQGNGSNYVAEISIPGPVITKDFNALPIAQQIGDFHNVKPENYPGAQLPASSGLVYLEDKDTFYTSFGDDYNVSFTKRLSHGSFSPDFSAVNGLWMVGDADDRLNPHTDAYIRWMMRIPTDWANTYTPGKTIISGGSRGGGTPMGVGMIAVQPWNDDGSVPASDSEIEFTTLVQYDINGSGGNQVMAGNLNSDSWSGGAWLQNDAGSAVLIAGTKMYGEYFYGFHDGTVYADIVHNIPTNHASVNTGKGGRGRSFRTMLVFYDPADLARVATGELPPNQIQPYTSMWIDKYMLVKNEHNPNYEYRLGTVEFDSVNKLIYVVERRVAWVGYDIIDVVHVFKLLE